MDLLGLVGCLIVGLVALLLNFQLVTDDLLMYQLMMHNLFANDGTYIPVRHLLMFVKVHIHRHMPVLYLMLESNLV
jgi:hypothetical protein